MTDITELDHKAAYGTLDASFLAAGGIEGIEKLVKDFYDQMEILPEAKKIRDMHAADLTESRDKLARFLCAWMGGPRRYSEKYGSINIPGAHRHLNIGDAERDAWLQCMSNAIAMQQYQDDFAVYLLKQLRIPAERIRHVCQMPKA
ncbi:MAG: group II truncated hemoglobin [Alcanivoracaceae bacterium]|nr:group II truncated hemoglobin [Alcanivoracaceae bacterium]